MNEKGERHVHWCDSVEKFIIERNDSANSPHELFYQRKDYDQFERDATKEEIFCYFDEAEANDGDEEEEKIKAQTNTKTAATATTTKATATISDRWGNGDESSSSFSSELDTATNINLMQPNIPSRRPSPPNLASLIADYANSNNNDNNPKKKSTVTKTRAAETNILVTPKFVSSFESERISNVLPVTSRITPTEGDVGNNSSCDKNKNKIIAENSTSPSSLGRWKS